MTKFLPLTADRAAYHLVWTPYEEQHLLEQQAETLAKLLPLDGEGDSIQRAEEIDGFSVSTIESWFERAHLFEGIQNFLTDPAAQAKIFDLVETCYDVSFEAHQMPKRWTDISPDDDFDEELRELGGIYATIADEEDDFRFEEFDKMIRGYADDIVDYLIKVQRQEAIDGVLKAESLEALQSGIEAAEEYAGKAGVDTVELYNVVVDLPTFGGADLNIENVFSWNETDVLFYGDNRNGPGWHIEPRSDFEEEEDAA